MTGRTEMVLRKEDGMDDRPLEGTRQHERATRVHSAVVAPSCDQTIIEKWLLIMVAIEEWKGSMGVLTMRWNTRSTEGKW